MEVSEYLIDKQQSIAEGSEGRLYNCIHIHNRYEKLCAKIVEIREDQIEKQLDILYKLKNNGNNMNLVSIKHYEYLEKEKSIVIIMEKCQFTLKNELERRKNELERRKNNKEVFSVDEIQDFLLQFVSGYQILYNNKILHRDIKPDNILINKLNDRLIYKLTDFGISKICDPNINILEMTQIGTPIYSPPEQYLGTSVFNFKQQDDDFPQSKRDVYSLGIILHQMITGELPFPPTKSKQFINELQNKPFKMASHNQNTALTNLIEQMIQYHPNNRISIPKLIQKINNNQQPISLFNSFRMTKNVQQNINGRPFIKTENIYFNEQAKQINLNIQQNNQFGQFQPIINNQTTPNNQKVSSNNIPQISPSENDKGISENKKVSSSNSNQFQQNPITQNVNIDQAVFKPNFQPINQNINTSQIRFSTILMQQINVLQTIKQYIVDTINNYECIIDEEVLKKLKQISLNQNQISDENVKLLKRIFQFDKTKINYYNFQRLQFFYCLINYQLVNIQPIPDINNLKQKLNEQFQD